MKHKIVKYFLLVCISFSAGIAGALALYRAYVAPHIAEAISQNGQLAASMPIYRTLSPAPFPDNTAGFANFVKASEVARPSVVYIKVMSQGRRNTGMWDPFFDFFGNIGPVSSSGSGVIISADGYIVTNSHVVNSAEKIEVVMNDNKRSFDAEVIGIDASTDLALLKIKASNLPAVDFADSDNLPIGDWVLAVGNPFNLTSTVTAGIVSAKGRNISLVQNQFPIESFIQTDAAINPGNSGGALVNTSGKLVGINTAILSKTGSYAGYGFAIPGNIVKKVVNDLKEFGFVQRAFLEAEVSDIDEKLLASLQGENVNGVYVSLVLANGNADKAGIKQGDLILKVGGRQVDTRAVFDEQLAYHRPGNVVKMVIKRGKDIKEVSVTLTNMRGTVSLEKAESLHSEPLGADVEEITRLEMEKYGISTGFRLSNIKGGQIGRMGLPEGFIVTSFNGQIFQNAKALVQTMESATGRIQIEGIRPDGSKGYYQFYWRAN